MNEKIVYMSVPVLASGAEFSEGQAPLRQSNKVAAVQNAKKTSSVKVLKKVAVVAKKSAVVAKKSAAASKSKKN